MKFVLFTPVRGSTCGKQAIPINGKITPLPFLRWKKTSVCSSGIQAVFALIPGDDPTYGYIDGSWLNDAPYAAIHRVASSGKRKGVLQECLDYCIAKHQNLRIDTHFDNKIMQHLLEKYGFQRCGTIYLENGDPRIAYQLIK